MTAASRSSVQARSHRSRVLAVLGLLVLASTASQANQPEVSAGAVPTSPAAASAPKADVSSPVAQAPDSAAAAPATTPTPPDPTAAGANRAWPHPKGGDLAQRTRESVARLARKLNLDAAQQEKLRLILLEQHAQMVALRNGSASGAVDVAGSTLAIYDQTKERIRGILNEDQKKKYFADVPRGQMAPAHADLQHWLDVRDGKVAPEHTGEAGN